MQLAKEAQEGKKLASKVDELRKLHVDEEARLRKFREESLKTLLEDIASKNREKENLETEITRLITKRNEAQIPLDDAWAEVKKEQEVVKQLKNDLYTKQVALEQEQEQYITRVKIVEEEERRVSEFLRAIELEEAATRSDMEKNAGILRETEERKKYVESQLEEEKATLQKFEKELLILDRDLGNKEKVLEKRDIDQNNRERLLQDRYSRLEVAEDFIRKKQQELGIQ